MANPEHLKILKQGVKVWNRWRDDNSDVILPNLRGADLRYAHFHDAVFYNPNLFPADPSTAYLRGVNLTGTDLRETDLRYADLCGVNLYKADLRGANLSGAILQNAALNGAFLSGTNLRGANLSGTVLQNADFSESVLCEADLSDSKLGGARLSSADLRGAILIGTDFTGTDLADVKLANANFLKARMAYTGIRNVDLSEVKNLESINHLGPSSVGIDTIYKSHGNIPEKFLRGCGVPEDFITYMRSLTGKAIEFYSCFISYSSKDEEFAKRLHADLQHEGVRCWFAPEDLKIGDKFRVRIDESIRLHDKLLLVLSENSVSSQWVEDEVEAALEKEREQNKTMLFPVRLDSAVMDVKEGWPAAVRRNRHIGDFSDWKNHDSYRKAFDRLMRDLKAEARRES